MLGASDWLNVAVDLASWQFDSLRLIYIVVPHH
jgi:hypothetical protein